ncbi:branched-chain alpha-ketoacid dehydrogenase kinase [Poronia punctata]|nr:branched-chain alpha-ketoacid dehydrogenase kinase [Poronia punctata]
MLPFAVHNATRNFRLRARFLARASNVVKPIANARLSLQGHHQSRHESTDIRQWSGESLGGYNGRRWAHTAKWRPMQVLDEWVAREARPISLRQLMVFGRSLTEDRLISSANYVRTELPTRIAHRIRDMQRLPYVVVTNPHISDVYELYYTAFDTFRRVKEIKNLEDNERFCSIIAKMLRAHLTVIPKLAMGILECNDLMPGAELDRFMNTILRSRISRRVIAEQHLALTETFNSDWFSPGAMLSESEFIGEVFLKCAARDVVERCGRAVTELARSANGPDAPIPEIRVDGHLQATFPYILSHLEYIIGELLRNSVQAVIDHHRSGPAKSGEKPPPIEVTLCEAAQHVIIRISDRGGGIPRDVLPYLWSFGKGPSKNQRLQNLGQVPLMAATLQELRMDGNFSEPQNEFLQSYTHSNLLQPSAHHHDGSLKSLSTRPPDLRLGMGLPLSRVYAEYWAGSLELHSLEGYGVDAFLQISKLGNKNEQLATRAAMDAV